jgi:hypothetical protein
VGTFLSFLIMGRGHAATSEHDAGISKRLAEKYPEGTVPTKKQARILRFNEACQKRKVLLLVHLSQGRWAGKSRSSGRCELTVRYVSCQREVLAVLAAYVDDLAWVDTVVLAPCHGAKDRPNIIWSDTAKVTTCVYPCVEAAYRSPPCEFVHVLPRRCSYRSYEECVGE